MVYFILAPHSLCVKIGFTDGSPKARLKRLQSGSPEPLLLLGVVAGDRSDEVRIRNQFMGCPLRGEWVGLTSELREYLVSRFANARHWLRWVPNFDPELWNFHPWPEGSTDEHFRMHVDAVFGKGAVA